MAIDMGIHQVKKYGICSFIKHTDIFGTTQFEEEGQVNPLKYMCEMRSDRGGTVQTPVSML